MTRFELVTSSLPRKRSTPELHRRKVFTITSFTIELPLDSESSLYAQGMYRNDNTVKLRAGDRVRTGDIQLGRLTLYQLSYSRI